MLVNHYPLVSQRHNPRNFETKRFVEQVPVLQTGGFHDQFDRFRITLKIQPGNRGLYPWQFLRYLPFLCEQCLDLNNATLLRDGFAVFPAIDCRKRNS